MNVLTSGLWVWASANRPLASCGELEFVWNNLVIWCDSVFVYIVNNTAYQYNIYPRHWFSVEEINYKTLLRTTLIHKDCSLKIKPTVECNLTVIEERLSFLPVSGFPLSQGCVPSTRHIIGVQSCCAGLLGKGISTTKSSWLLSNFTVSIR